MSTPPAAGRPLETGASSAMSISLSVAKAVRWSGMSRAVAQLFRWAMTLMVIRILGPEDYGLMALSVASFNLIFTVYEMGLTPAVVQSKTLEDGDAGRVAGLVVLISVGICLAMLIAAPWIAGLFDEPALIDILRLMSLALPTFALAAVPYAMLERNLDFKTIAILHMITELCAATITLALALAGFGVWSLVYGYLAHTLLHAGLVFFVCPPGCLPSFRLKGTRRFVNFGGMIVVQRIVSAVYRNADVFILGRATNVETVGLYSVALEFSTMPLRKITPVVNSIAFASFSRIQDDKVLIAQYLEKAFRCLLLIGLPVFAGISSAAPEITAVILGPNWSAVALPLQLLCLVAPIRLLADPLQQTLNGIGQARLALQNTLTIAITLIIAFAIGAQYGSIGICLAWLIALPAAFFVVLIRSAPCTGMTIGRFLRLIMPPVTSCLLMYLAVLGAGGLMPLPVDSILRLVTLVGVGALGYGAAILLLCPRDVADLWRFLRP